MKYYSVMFFKIILTTSLVLFSNVNASTSDCSDKKTEVCTQETGNSGFSTSCVKNSSLKDHFISYPSSVIGNCSDFDIKKIKTYACNAGLRFINPSSVLCIKRDQNNATASDCGDSLDCSCSSDESTSSTLNYFNFGIAEYKDGSPVSFIKKTLNSSSNQNFATASNTSGKDVLEDGSALQFNMGSDFYGAEYFVDLCIQNKNIDAYKYDLNLTGKILFANAIFTNNSYINASSLYSKVDIICSSTNGSQSTKEILSSTPLNANQNYSGKIDGSSLCVARHYFKETTQNKIRENNFKKVTFQTNINVTPKDSALSNPIPVFFCNKKTIKGQEYCDEWRSESREAFAIDILKDTTFFGNDTYSDECHKQCKNN